MLRIGEFSKLSRVSIRMLRYYDEINLLKPACIDPESGYRYYGEEQLLAAGRVASLKSMGFGLSDIRQVIEHADQMEVYERYLCSKREELQREYRALCERMQILDTAIDRLRKDEAMKYDVIVKTFPESYAATVRMSIPSYDAEGMLWGILTGETEALCVVPDEPCYFCAVFYDKEYKETDVDVEVLKTVKGSYADTEHVRFRILPEVTVASATCKGSYEQMGDVMAEVAQWVIANGYAFDGPTFNIYHVSPHETANPEEYVTEVCYPVRKK